MLSKMSAYRRDFDETEYISFMIKNEEKQNEIWNKVSNTINNGFDSKPFYNEKNLKTKTKYFEGKINTNFYGNKIPKKGSQCICLSLSMYLLIDLFCFYSST